MIATVLLALKFLWDLITGIPGAIVAAWNDLKAIFAFFGHAVATTEAAVKEAKVIVADVQGIAYKVYQFFVPVGVVLAEVLTLMGDAAKNVLVKLTNSDAEAGVISTYDAIKSAITQYGLWVVGGGTLTQAAAWLTLHAVGMTNVPLAAGMVVVGHVLLFFSSLAHKVTQGGVGNS